jgi:hypothetical protein
MGEVNRSYFYTSGYVFDKMGDSGSRPGRSERLPEHGGAVPREHGDVMGPRQFYEANETLLTRVNDAPARRRRRMTSSTRTSRWPRRGLAMAAATTADTLYRLREWH